MVSDINVKVYYIQRVNNKNINETVLFILHGTIYGKKQFNTAMYIWYVPYDLFIMLI